MSLSQERTAPASTAVRNVQPSAQGQSMAIEFAAVALDDVPTEDLDGDEQEQAEAEAELEELLASLTPAAAESSRPTRGKVRRRARGDRQDEVAFLRSKVQQMEEELRALRLQHLDNMVPVPAASAPAASLAFSGQAFGFPVSAPQVTEAPPIWDIAARQQRWRQKALRENARLRMVLDTQASLARSMESQLGRRIRQQLSDGRCTLDVPGAFPVQSAAPSFTLETETIESLRRGLDTAYDELDIVFAANGLDQLGTPYTEARIREGPKGMYLDIFANKLLPFDFETTATATWNHYRGDDRQRANLYQDFTEGEDSSADTIMEMVAMKFTGKATNADFRVKQALRRYEQPDRQVVVWVSRAEAIESQVSAYSNFAFVDKGYVVVKRPVFPEQEHHPSTLLQICCLISPQMANGCVLDVTSVGAFTEFVLSVMVASITATQELVEGMLIEEAKQLVKQRG